MGANRKRLPGDRSISPSQEAGVNNKKKAMGNKKPKKKKDKKKNRDRSSSGATDHHHPHHKSSLETTATAEGQIMAQVISTFSRIEQSRFEAFRRATFAKDAIAKFVAHCLIEEQHRPISKGTAPPPQQPLSSLPTHISSPHDDEIMETTTTTSHPSLREPILSEVVAPGQAEDITIVVTALAKAYAQRLVTVARRYASIRNANQNAQVASTITNTITNTNGMMTTPVKANPNVPINCNTSSTYTSSSITAAAIAPEDIMKAYEERKVQGLDPGFFLQPWDPSSIQHSMMYHNNTNHSMTNNSITTIGYEQKRLATLYLQEQYYDKVHGGAPPPTSPSSSSSEAKEDKEEEIIVEDDDQQGRARIETTESW